MHLALVPPPRQHSAAALLEAEAPIGLALPADPMRGMVKPQQWFQSALGRRRSFLSATDAAAYDLGCRLSGSGSRPALHTPFSAGYSDCSSSVQVHA